MTDTVIATRRGRIGHILLNRPKALNALDLAMIRAMTETLETWRDDPAVHAVSLTYQCAGVNATLRGDP